MASSKNIGDQIRDAVQDAVNSQDFSALQSTIERSVSVAAKNISKGLARASESMQQAQANRLQDQDLRRQKQMMQIIYAKSTPSKALGYAMAIGGGVAAAPLLLGAAIVATSGIAAFYVPPLVLAAGGIALCGFGIHRLGLVKRFELYRNIIGAREYCTIEELATRTATSPKSVLKNLRTMLKKGMFRQAALDDEEQFLITTHDAYREYRAAQLEAQHRSHQQTLAQSVEIPSGQKQPLTPEAQALLSRGEAFVAKIRMSNEAIPGKEISRTIDQIEHTVRTIFERAEEQPQVIGDLDKLMDYYLPTTVKLLDAYHELDSQPIQGENIQKSKREIEAALSTLSTAFEKLLDSVFREMTWDVSTDISVLHTVLSQEGLVDDPFEKKPAGQQPHPTAKAVH